MIAAIAFATLVSSAVGADLVPTTLPASCQWRAADGAESLVCQTDDGDVDVAYTGFRRSAWAAAQAQNAAGLRDLGRFYAFAPATVRDPARALAMLEAAAAKGDLLAMAELGMIHRDGVGTPIDMGKAAEWYRKAADGGDPAAAFQLGELELRGLGPRQDLQDGIQRLRFAADRDNADALWGLGQAKMRGLGVKVDPLAARQFFERAAALGSANAMDALAYIHANGLGVPKDMEQAKTWTQAAHEIRGKFHAPNSDTRANTYPIAAAIVGLDGTAIYLCRLVAAGAIEDCHVTSETPAGFGFGEAGLQLLAKIERSPRMQSGSEIKMPIRFVAPDMARDAKTADRCAAEAIALAKLRPLSPAARWMTRYWTALSARAAGQAGISDTPDRLAPEVAAATQRLEKGGDGGLFGRLGRCDLN